MKRNTACLIGFFVVFVVVVTFVESKDYPWLNDNDIKVINRTDTSVVLAWRLPREMSLRVVKNYRLVVRYRRQGYSPKTIEAHHTDPDCSLLLSYCHLRDLVRGKAYSVTILIDDVRNRTVLGQAVFAFSTLDGPGSDDVVWWLLYAAVPAALLILLLVIILCIARCCRCWCWRKKKKSIKIKPKPLEDKEQKKETGTASSDSSSLDRKHSIQTRQWVKDTLATIDLDPESSMYDQPQASVHYEIPQGMTSTQSNQTDSKITRDHYYLEVFESNEETTSAFTSRDGNKSASTTPDIKPKEKKLKKLKTNSNLLTSAADLSSLANNQEHRLPPQPCRIKPPTDMLRKTSSLPLSKPETPMHPAPKGSTPPTSPMSELQQKLQDKLQQQLMGEQTALETHHYANTNDLHQLKGNARKMFPML